MSQDRLNISALHGDSGLLPKSCLYFNRNFGAVIPMMNNMYMPTGAIMASQLWGNQLLSTLACGLLHTREFVFVTLNMVNSTQVGRL